MDGLSAVDDQSLQERTYISDSYRDWLYCRDRCGDVCVQLLDHMLHRETGTENYAVSLGIESSQWLNCHVPPHTYSRNTDGDHPVVDGKFQGYTALIYLIFSHIPWQQLSYIICTVQ